MPHFPDAKLLQHPRASGSVGPSGLISFSRNAASYFPRPRLRSQTTMSTTGAPQSWVVPIIFRSIEGVQGRLDYGCLRGSRSGHGIKIKLRTSSTLVDGRSLA